MTTFTDQEPLQPSMSKTAPEPDTVEAKHDGLTTPVETKISGFWCRITLNRSSRKEAFGAVFLDPMINHDCLTDMNKVVEH